MAPMKMHGASKHHEEQHQTSPVGSCAIPNATNVRIHTDLFGPLKYDNNNNIHVLCMTKAFTQITVVVPILDKEAITVATNIFRDWQ